MRIENVVIWVLFIVACIGCNNDDDPMCPEMTDLGSFDLLQSSIDIFPYSNDDAFAVFSDSMGNEIYGEISEVVVAYIGDTVDIPCAQSPGVNVSATAQVEQIRTTIKFPDLNRILEVYHRATPLYGFSTDHAVADLATVSIYEMPFPQSMLLQGTITVVIDRRSWPFDPVGTAPFRSSVVLDGKEYLEVYSAETLLGDYVLYYSFTQGLIGFEDLNEGVTYKFERIE